MGIAKCFRWLKSNFFQNLDNFIFLTPYFWTVCPLVNFQPTTVDGISICLLCFRNTTLTTCPCIQLVQVSLPRPHAFTCTHSHVQTYILTLAYTHACMCECGHKHARTHARTHMHIYILVHVSALECAGKPYDTDTHICCDGHLHRNSEYWGRLSCCQAKAYNAKTHVCCDWDRVMPKEWVKGHGKECYGRRFTSNADS